MGEALLLEEQTAAAVLGDMQLCVLTSPYPHGHGNVESEAWAEGVLLGGQKKVGSEAGVEGRGGAGAEGGDGVLLGGHEKVRRGQGH